MELKIDLTPRERGAYGLARARDILFDSVLAVYREQKAQGLTIELMAERIGRKPETIRRALSAPGNWTLKTFGELIEALDAEIVSSVDIRPRPR